jgi:hypothetical protein
MSHKDLEGMPGLCLIRNLEVTEKWQDYVSLNIKKARQLSFQSSPFYLMLLRNLVKESKYSLDPLLFSHKTLEPCPPSTLGLK